MTVHSHYLSPDRTLITFSNLMSFVTFPNLIEADLRAPDRTLLINSHADHNKVCRYRVWDVHFAVSSCGDQI